MLLSTRERILMLRILGKILMHPQYAEALGIEGKLKEVYAR